MASDKDKKAGAAYDEATIRGLAKLLDETGLTEIEIERGGERIRIGRAARATQIAAAPALPHSAPAPMAPVPVNDPAKHPGALRSPMVGTVYLSPEPGAAQFVQVGEQVAQGQTLLIIEAMKVMNQIPAPRAGRVARILVENGSPVEYGQVLLLIE